MSKYKYQDTELRLMEVSQDCTSEAFKGNTRQPASFSMNQINNWDAAWDESIENDEFIDIEEIVDADMDADILDLDEY